MVKPDKKNSLGRSLVKSRFGSNRKKTVDNGSMLHTTAVQDGYEWGRLNLQSVTEESSFQEFLSTAELANTEFQAEKLNLKLVAFTNGPIMNAETRATVQKKHNDSKHLLRVPRRPVWTRDMGADQVQENERTAFLDWRRNLAAIQEDDGLILTPYEKNLEFWRQLWRVLERSHILIQVVDARNPLLFRCEDLEDYAKEVGVKACLLLLNKADLLSEKQRCMWAEYFDKQGVKVAFFSAFLAAEKNKLKNAAEDDIPEEDEEDSSEDEETSSEDEETRSENKESEENTDDKLKVDDVRECFKKLEDAVDNTSEKLETLMSKMVELDIIKENTVSNDTEGKSTSTWDGKNNTEILDKEGLMDLLRNVNIEHSDRLAVGLVGYPNVGKSSTINALMDAKKVSVSATPGKTKHFQTLLLEDDLMLCDCPGLVLPSFVCTKAEMVVHGILPIDHMREYMDAISLVTESLGGRAQAERRLAILLPPPPSDDPNELPPRDVLNAYAYSRGMMTGMGTPDCARAARAVLRGATKGALPLVVVPPGADSAEYMSVLYPTLPELKNDEKRREMTPQEKRALKMDETAEDIDKRFFSGNSNPVHTKGVPGKACGLPVAMTLNGEGKPWKKNDKHGKKNKKEKLRKVYFHLDKH